MPPEPQLSVVVATFNNRAVLARCLASWERYAAGRPVELIVVEDGCTDDTAAFLADRQRSPWGRRHLRWVHEENVHELLCTNRGFAEARGPLVLSWHDDMFLRSRRLVPELVRTFAAYPEVGLLALSRGLVCRPADRLPERWEALHDWSRLESTIGPAPANWTHLTEVDAVIRPWAVRADAVAAVGPLDPAYRPTEWDEADLCFRLRAAGWAVAVHGYERLGWYSHVGSSTLSRTLSDAYKARVLANGRRFHERWAEAIRAGSNRPPRRWRRRADPGGWAATTAAAVRRAGYRLFSPLSPCEREAGGEGSGRPPSGVRLYPGLTPHPSPQPSPSRGGGAGQSP